MIRRCDDDVEARKRVYSACTQEQTEVAEQFARLIATNPLSTDDVTQILDDHAHSVHLLRMRQRDERQRLLDRLDAKRHAHRRTDQDDDEAVGDQQQVIQEGLAVASIARDDPSPLPGMHRDHNSPACTATAMRGKFGSEFET